MTEREKRFEEKLKDVIGEYCPNDTCLSIFSSYVYRLALSVLSDCDSILEESEEHSNITGVDTAAFLKSLKDISMFVSQDAITEAFKETYLKVKNTVPMTKRDTSVAVGSGIFKSGKKSIVYEQNSASFDVIDLDSIPKAQSILKDSPVSTVNKTNNSSNEFEGDFDMDFESINSSKPKTSSKKEESDSDDEEFSTDASIFTSGEYSSVPKISVDLDY